MSWKQIPASLILRELIDWLNTKKIGAPYAVVHVREDGQLTATQPNMFYELYAPPPPAVLNVTVPDPKQNSGIRLEFKLNKPAGVGGGAAVFGPIDGDVAFIMTTDKQARSIISNGTEYRIV